MNIPCKNCITLSICKAQAELDKLKFVDIQIIRLDLLIDKCIIFRNYCTTKGSYKSAIEFFGNGDDIMRIQLKI